MNSLPVSPDNTNLGDRSWDHSSYAFVQSALELLHAKLSSWNTIAMNHGALAPPYIEEVDDLKIMANWGEERLGAGQHTITVNGITVGSIRNLKAALLFAAWHFELEAAKNTEDSWPGKVVEAVRGRARRYQELADELAFPPAKILDDLRPEFGMTVKPEDSGATWDAFVSHASEDKAPFVGKLVEALKATGLNIWYDDFTLTVGDSLRRSIDRGLARSRYGIVILSPAFFAKEWPQRELDGLVAREVHGHKVVLPVWHDIDESQIRRYSPMLADRLGVHSSKGVPAVVQALLQVIRS